MGEGNFDDALTPLSTVTDVSAARVRPLGHAVDIRQLRGSQTLNVCNLKSSGRTPQPDQLL